MVQSVNATTGVTTATAVAGGGSYFSVNPLGGSVCIIINLTALQIANNQNRFWLKNVSTGAQTASAAGDFCYLIVTGLNQ